MRKTIISSFVALSALQAHAQGLTIPNSFTSGTAISSSAMNANFSSIQSFINGSVCQSGGANCPAFGTVTSITAGTGLTGGTITGSGSLSVDVGTGANQIVQLPAAGILPALSGANLTNLNPASLAGPVAQAQGGTGGSSRATARNALGIPWDFAASDAYFTGGNVGIGTSSPSTLLHLLRSNGLGLLLQSSTDTFASGVSLEFDANGNKLARVRPYSQGPSLGGDLYLETSSDGSMLSTRMIIKKDGNIGIGTTNPTSLLTVYAVGTPSLARFNTNTATSGLLIGYGTGEAVFDNLENTNFSFKMAGTEKANITNVGVYNQISDERLKKDFSPLQDVFQKLSQLKGFTYRFKDDRTQSKQLGLKAQDVEKSFPELVTKRKDGIKAVAYAGLVAPLIDAVNFLHKRVVELESPSTRSPASESRMEKLEVENAQMKAWICAKDKSAPFCSK